MITTQDKCILFLAIGLLFVSTQVSRYNRVSCNCPRPSSFICSTDEDCGQCAVHQLLYNSKCVHGLCNLCVEEVLVPT
jgi:hypothetical protein